MCSVYFFLDYFSTIMSNRNYKNRCEKLKKKEELKSSIALNKIFISSKKNNSTSYSIKDHKKLEFDFENQFGDDDVEK